jgi:maltooligosyltrehalose trehalohydrolase
LLGDSPRGGGLDVRWKTIAGDTLQIVANFADRELPMPSLSEGETLWRLHTADSEALRPSDVIVRLLRP